MRIKYIVIHFMRTDGGVFTKIKSQIRALGSLGIETELVQISRSSSYQVPLDTKVSFRAAPVPPFKSMKEKFQSASAIAGAISEEIKLADSNTVLYLRGLIPSPFLLRCLRKPRQAVVVFELQSIGWIEAKNRGSRMHVLTDKLYTPAILQTCDGIVGVTEEIAKRYISRARNAEIPWIANGNGANVDLIPVRTPPAFDKKRLNLLAVATNFAYWHAIDRIIESIAKYRGHTRVFLDVIGGVEALSGSLKKFVESNNLGEQVRFHGFMKGKEFDGFFDKCHIAVGSLGLHRKGLSQTSELKAREYCARGTPFICSSPDADFPADFPYVLRVNSSEKPIDIEQIISFARRVCSEGDHPHVMREYALSNLDWSIKMKKLVEFFDRILQSKCFLQ